MSYSEIEAILKPLDKSPKKVKKPTKQYTPTGIGGDLSQKILQGISMEEILSEASIDTSKNPTDCPFHSSAGGKCFGFNDETAHCFHCDGSWNKFSLVRELKQLTDKETFEWFAEKGGMIKELKESRKEYKKKKEEKKEEEGKGDYSAFFSRRGQIEAFWKKQPFFYDKSKMFWLWDKENKKWELSDEVDYLNSIQKELGVDTITTKVRVELVEGFKQVGRNHKPKDIKKFWVQFRDKIYDVKTGESFKATPEYFVTNPIPWNVGESEDTPTIDKLFSDWMKGQDISWKDTLYEILAYNTCLNKFMQRIIGLCGGGSNGKGTFMELNYKFLGEDNCVSSEIKLLAENQFQAAVLYRKLLCVMGEVSYDDLRNTNQIKKLAGEDKISFEFKGKNAFTDENTATCICLTNSLPITPDKSKGFYRKWLIVDFLNQFTEINIDLIGTIPDVEFENLAKKSLRILKELYQNPEFTNEGDFEEREKRYEERSNPIMRFVEEYCEEEVNKSITLRDFANKCNDFLKKKHLRVITAIKMGKILRDEGFSVGQRRIDDISAVVILNIKYSEKPLEPLEPSKSPVSPYIESTRDSDGFLYSNGYLDKKDINDNNDIKEGLSDEEFEKLKEGGE